MPKQTTGTKLRDLPDLSDVLGNFDGAVDDDLNLDNESIPPELDAPRRTPSPAPSALPAAHLRLTGGSHG